MPQNAEYMYTAYAVIAAVSPESVRQLPTIGSAANAAPDITTAATAANASVRNMFSPE